VETSNCLLTELFYWKWKSCN